MATPAFYRGIAKQFRASTVANVKMIGVGVGMLAVASAIHGNGNHGDKNQPPSSTTSSTTTASPAPAPAPSSTTSTDTTSNAAPASAPLIPSGANYPKFSSASFWYTPLPATPPLDPNSANLVAEFQRQFQTYYGNVGVNTTAYSSPIYIASQNEATQPVAVWDCHNNGWIDSGLAQQWTAVPIPSYAQPADGTDSEMTIYQPSTDTLWEFWEMQKTANGTWQACWGGRMTGVSSNPGIWTKPYGAAATGLPFAPGQITADDIKNGVINHVIGIALVDVENWDKWSWPANRSDGWNPNNLPNRIREGQRFRIDPSVNIDALNLTSIARMVAKAGQTYGFVVWDKAGSISVRFENPKSFTQVGQPDPYVTQFNGVPNYALLDGIPWNKLQFLPVDYGNPN